MKSYKRLFGYALALAILAIPVVVYSQRQPIMDWWLLRNYSPPAAVSTLATQDTMTNSARHIFYVNHPQILSNVADFRRSCTSSEQTIVLGCYHGYQRGIYIYDVKDSRLSGVEQVTAAHEMLHAAYDRLSSSEKARVDGLLKDYYKNQLKDQRIIDTINSYKKSEPTELVNEMHSIFGTEIASLPTELEGYYKQYFVNRQAVVVFAQGYQSEFNRRTEQINADDARLKSLKSEIDQLETSLALQYEVLQASRVGLDNLRSTGRIQEYNSAIPGYNSKVNSYNYNVNSLQSKINTYNALVATRNALAGELRQLDQAIDTRLQAEPSR